MSVNSRWIAPSLLSPVLGLLASGATAASLPFINELHYDNAGGDEGEGVELLAAAGTSLADWTLALYNGSNGAVYETIVLEGVVEAQSDGVGTVFFAVSGLQNGPDGIALVAPDATVVQFLSYEGSFSATDGPAATMLSVDIGVAEGTDAAIGTSLQLVGRGRAPADFEWIGGATASYGALNVGQEIAAVPLPGNLALLGSAFAGLLGLRRAQTYRRRGMKLQHKARQAIQSSTIGMSTVSNRKLAVSVTT
ncbi:MAG: hypothetical protein AAGA68_03625 [Pseudomonadota bacterium]